MFTNPDWAECDDLVTVCDSESQFEWAPVTRGDGADRRLPFHIGPWGGTPNTETL